MVKFRAAVRVQAPAGRVWAVMTDWRRHGDWVPLTSVRVVTAHGDGVGASFVARTAVGPLGFDDPMTVTGWQPPGGDEPGDGPGRCDVDKTGRIVRGKAWFEVVPLAGGASEVVWHEDVTVWPARLTRPVGGAVSAVGRVLFTRTLRTMAREAEAG